MNMRKLITLVEQNDQDKPLVPVTRTDINRSYSPRDIDRLKKISDLHKVNPEKDAGTYYLGKADPQDPHAFRKHEKLPQKPGVDAYVSYVNELIKLNGSNPYLPVIYNIKRTGDQTNVRHKFTMEKLVKIRDVGVKDLLFVLKRLIRDLKPGKEKNEAIEEYNILIKKWNNNDQERVWPIYGQITWIIHALIHDYCETHDTALNQAIDILKKVLASHSNIDVDLECSTDNILLRNTSKGYWPVITDPFCNG